ncbi:MAG: T9SS type A sorting domain-containing protein [Ignavibacteria bacterium]|nr:T9SS type A sorting domain-containing protein [Ignavibacteria bacterium]
MIDIDGNLLWEKIYPATYTLDLIRVELALDGGYVVGGKKKNFSGGPENSYFAKINDTGALQWEKEYQLNTSNIVSGIQTKNNGYVLTGWSNDKLYLLKVGINGDSIFTKIFINTSNVFYGPALLKENDNKYYAAHINNQASRIYSVDSNFNVINQITLQSSENIWTLSMIKAQSSIPGDIILVGITALTPGNEEAYAVRLDSSLIPPPPIGIIYYTTINPSEYILFQNYPNPFNPVTQIRFILKKSGNIELKIFDINGKLVRILMNSYYNLGEHYINFESNDLSSGIYFYQLLVNDKVINTRKMILLK